MPDRLVKYAPVAAGDRLHQGEILAQLIQVRQDLTTIGSANARNDEIIHPFAIILTQDCDLAQDFAARASENAGRGKLANILFCEAATTTELKSNVPQGKDIWKRVIQNKDERYQCLEEVPADQDSAGQSVPSLGCDFKQFFTVPADEVYKRIELHEIARRCRLLTPYAEHLLQRFCNFQARVALPQNHDVQM